MKSRLQKACFFFVVLQLIRYNNFQLFTNILHLLPEIMSHQTLISKPIGSSARAFIQSAVLSSLILVLVFILSGDFKEFSLKAILFPSLFVPLAGGVAGLIFRNTTGLRQAVGLKKILGWTIGILAYLVLVPMALVLGLNGPN